VPENDYSFIIRIWVEATDSAGQVTAWRGSIDLVGTQHRLYFQDMAQIEGFIQHQLNLVGGRSQGQMGNKDNLDKSYIDNS